MKAERTPEAGRLEEVARAFAGRRVLVVGDLIADQFLFGEISRVSREAGPRPRRAWRPTA
jgi:hypothetical protein